MQSTSNQLEMLADRPELPPVGMRVVLASRQHRMLVVVRAHVPNGLGFEVEWRWGPVLSIGTCTRGGRLIAVRSQFDDATFVDPSVMP